MEEVFRSLVGRFNESVRGYLKSSRKRSRLPIQVTIQPKIETTSLLKNHLAEAYAQKKKNLSTSGEMLDIDKKGISFIVPFIRLGEHYLVGGDTYLNLEIDLPNGKLRLKAVGCRYEQVEQDSSVGRFLVGARIVGTSEKDDALLTEYLEAEKGTGRAKVKNVQWGLDLPRS
jgi:hypothetical protein